MEDKELTVYSERMYIYLKLDQVKDTLKLSSPVQKIVVIKD
jgi:hypothetical protein